MIGVELAAKSILRAPRRHVIAVLGIMSVLTPLMLIWSMKVGFVSGLMNELRSAPSNLELRLRGDYVLNAEKVAQIRALPGIGFVIPTARLLATRAFASLEGGARQTPVSLMPTGPGDPLTQEGGRIDAGTALVSQTLAEKLNLSAGSLVEVSNFRRDQAESLRIRLRVLDRVQGEGVGGQWLFVAPELVQAVEAFIDGYAVPQYHIEGKPPADRPPIYSSARLYARSIEEVQRVEQGLEALGFVVESNAARINSVLKLDRILNAVVAVMGMILVMGLGLSVWAGLAAILEQLRRHIALLSLMGASRSNIGLYFITIGMTVAVIGTGGASLLTSALAQFGNRGLASVAGHGRTIFALPALDLAIICAAALLLQLAITLSIAMRATRIYPQEMLRDD